MSTKSTDTKIKEFSADMNKHFSNATNNSAPEARTKIKQICNTMSAPNVLTEQVQLEDSIQRVHEAKIHTQEASHGDAWEILDGAKAKNAQDEDEWVLVENETGRIAEMA
jgi:hypothetical protein